MYFPVRLKYQRQKAASKRGIAIKLCEKGIIFANIVKCRLHRQPQVSSTSVVFDYQRLTAEEQRTSVTARGAYYASVEEASKTQPRGM